VDPGGLWMSDLAVGSDPAAPQPWLGRALVYHPDIQLRRVLSLLLTQAGFTVDRVAAVEDLSEAAQASHVSLVVLAAGGTALDPLRGFRPAQGRTYTLVVLGAEHQAQARGAGADLVVPFPFDPATVVQEIVRVMPEHPPA
jgi:DNA-binding response OmpR family regulator